jgi:hypothetical protein
LSKIFEANDSIISKAKAASEPADQQRKLCLDWLLYIMAASSVRTRIKADIRAEAIQRLRSPKMLLIVRGLMQ